MANNQPIYCIRCKRLTYHLFEMNEWYCTECGSPYSGRKERASRHIHCYYCETIFEVVLSNGFRGVVPCPQCSKDLMITANDKGESMIVKPENYKFETERTKEIFEERKDLFIRKNESYGCAWAKIGAIFNIIMGGEPVVLKNYWDHTLFSLMVRMLDKVIRVCTLRFTGQEEKVGESVAETLGDLGVYAFMAQASVENHIKCEKDKGG